MTEDAQLATLIDAMSEEFAPSVLKTQSKERRMNTLQFMSTVLSCRPQVMELVASGTALRIRRYVIFTICWLMTRFFESALQIGEEVHPSLSIDELTSQTYN